MTTPLIRFLETDRTGMDLTLHAFATGMLFGCDIMIAQTLLDHSQEMTTSANVMAAGVLVCAGVLLDRGSEHIFSR